MQFTRDILESFEKGEYTLGVFIDLSKAFDTVDHEILLKKLKYYGVKGINLNWLKSYLSNRKQYVHSDGVLKQLLNINAVFLRVQSLDLYFFSFMSMIFTKLPTYLTRLCLRMTPIYF